MRRLTGILSRCADGSTPAGAVPVCAALAAGVWLACTPAAAQPAAGSPPPVADTLQAISRSMARVPNASVSLNFAEFKVRMATAKLQEAAARWPDGAPADYRSNVAAQASVLEQALRAPDAERLTSILEALSDDFTVKTTHAEKGGAPAVAVTVRTVQQGQDAAGWQVLYRPRVADVAGGGAGSEAAFPAAAAGPARAALVPGRYAIWGRRGSVNSTTIVVAIGDGLPDVQLDLDVGPEAAPRP